MISVEIKAIKALINGILLGFLIQFTGCPTFLNYAVLIFEQIGASNIDPNVSAIILAIAQILGGIASTTTLADTLGRKLTLIISFVGSSIGLFVLSLYLHLKKQHGYDLTEYSLVPVASISFVMFIASAGVISLFAVCFVESLPTKVQQFYIYIRISESISNTVQPNFSANFQVRTIGLTLIILFVYAFGFIFVKLFPMLMDAIGLDGCTASLCIGCILGAFFIMFTLEEKSGQPLDTLRSTENK